MRPSSGGLARAMSRYLKVRYLRIQFEHGAELIGRDLPSVIVAGDCAL